MRKARRENNARHQVSSSKTNIPIITGILNSTNQLCDTAQQEVAALRQMEAPAAELKSLEEELTKLIAHRDAIKKMADEAHAADAKVHAYINENAISKVDMEKYGASFHDLKEKANAKKIEVDAAYASVMKIAAAIKAQVNKPAEGTNDSDEHGNTTDTATGDAAKKDVKQEKDVPESVQATAAAEEDDDFEQVRAEGQVQDVNAAALALAQAERELAEAQEKAAAARLAELRLKQPQSSGSLPAFAGSRKSAAHSPTLSAASPSAKPGASK